MLFMVIEHFDQARVKDVYRRFHERGRIAPEGLAYVDSWIAADLARCFQVRRCRAAAGMGSVLERSRPLRDRADRRIEGDGSGSEEAPLTLLRSLRIRMFNRMRRQDSSLQDLSLQNPRRSSFGISPCTP